MSLPSDDSTQMSCEAFIHKMQLQYFDSLEDAMDPDWSHIPSSVLAHRVSFIPRRQIIPPDTPHGSTTVKLHCE